MLAVLKLQIHNLFSVALRLLASQSHTLALYPTCDCDW